MEIAGLGDSDPLQLTDAAGALSLHRQYSDFLIKSYPNDVKKRPGGCYSSIDDMQGPQSSMKRLEKLARSNREQERVLSRLVVDLAALYDVIQGFLDIYKRNRGL